MTRSHTGATMIITTQVRSEEDWAEVISSLYPETSMTSCPRAPASINPSDADRKMVFEKRTLLRCLPPHLDAGKPSISARGSIVDSVALDHNHTSYQPVSCGKAPIWAPSPPARAPASRHCPPHGAEEVEGVNNGNWIIGHEGHGGGDETTEATDGGAPPAIAPPATAGDAEGTMVTNHGGTPPAVAPPAEGEARGGTADDGEETGGGTADDGEETGGGTAGEGDDEKFVKATTCSCGSIRNAFEQVPDLFEQVRFTQLAPVPPTWGAHETQGIQTPGDLSGAGPHDGKQVVNPAAAGGAQVPSGDSPRGAPPTLSDSVCPPVKVLKSCTAAAANAWVRVRRPRSSHG